MYAHMGACASVHQSPVKTCMRTWMHVRACIRVLWKRVCALGCMCGHALESCENVYAHMGACTGMHASEFCKNVYAHMGACASVHQSPVETCMRTWVHVRACIRVL